MPRVLVVDDQPEVRTIISIVLRIPAAPIHSCARSSSMVMRSWVRGFTSCLRRSGSTCDSAAAIRSV